MTAAARIRDLRKAFGSHVVLDGLDLALYRHAHGICKLAIFGKDGPECLHVFRIDCPVKSINQLMNSSTSRGIAGLGFSRAGQSERSK